MKMKKMRKMKIMKIMKIVKKEVKMNQNHYLQMIMKLKMQSNYQIMMMIMPRIIKEKILKIIKKKLTY